MSLARSAVCAISTVVVLALAGCASGEHATRIALAPKLDVYDPPPPQDRQYVAIRGAKIPQKTRDGRSWGDLGNMPDPYLKLLVNGAEIYRTTPQSKTVNPTWPDAPHGNLPLKAGDEIRIEVWDDAALTDRPIGVKTVTFTGDNLSGPDSELELDGGVEVDLAVSPAIPVWGVGFSYEQRRDWVTVSKVLDASPASRAGIKIGDDLLRLAGKRVSQMSFEDVARVLGAIPADGVKATFAHADGSTLEATLKDGPIYALFNDLGDPLKPPR